MRCKTGSSRSDTSSRLPPGKPPPVHSCHGLFTLPSSPEIVQLRESNVANNVTEEPEFEDPGYRALVEENVKLSVSNIANDPIMQAVCLSLVSLCSVAGTNLVLLALGCFQP